jgi:hypothetical protein
MKYSIRQKNIRDFFIFLVLFFKKRDTLRNETFFFGNKTAFRPLHCGGFPILEGQLEDSGL